MKNRKPKEPKLPKGITPEFVDECNGSTTDLLKAKIVTFQGQIGESREFMKENDELRRLKDEVELVAGPIKETIRTLNARTKYIVEELKKKGAL